MPKSHILPISCLVIPCFVIRCCRYKSRNSFPTTIWYLQPRFQVPCLIHQSPLVLPILSWSVVNNLPRLVKRLEPIIQHVSLLSLPPSSQPAHQKKSVPFAIA